MVRPVRFERMTYRVGVCHSIQLSYGRAQKILYLPKGGLSRGGRWRVLARNAYLVRMSFSASLASCRSSGLCLVHEEISEPWMSANTACALGWHSAAG